MGGYQDAASSAIKQGTQETQEILQELANSVKTVETAVNKFNADSSRLGRWMLILTIALFFQGIVMIILGANVSQ